MRIIAGEFRGRTLHEPRDARVRPTTDRLREAWLSILDPWIPGAAVLDLYAGSGALGLEALSRGASRVEFVELSAPSLRALRTNVTELRVEDRARVRKGDALRFVAKLTAGAFDVAVADPPYTSDHAGRLVTIFRARPFARLLSVEHDATVSVPGDETRRYGSAALTLCYAP